MNVLDQTIDSLIGRLREAAPDLMQKLDEARNNKTDADDIMPALMALLTSRPDLEETLLRVSHDAFRPLREDTEEINPLLFEKDRGLPQLNPLMQGAIAERLQFDEDAPELRTGPMVEGTKPAVSVNTRARSPVAIGRMLQDASNRLASEVEAHEANRRKEIEGLATGDVTALTLKNVQWLQTVDGDPDFGAMAHGSAETDHPMYRRGSVPAPMTVEQPSGSVLAALTPQERRESAWKFLSTTQGRRTSLGVIRELVATHLRGSLPSLEEQEYVAEREVEVLAHHEWTVSIAGPNSNQPAFNVIETASRALAKGLSLSDMSPVKLEVVPVNTVDVRSVGWAARLVKNR